MDCRLPGSSVHGISQASVLEWVAISYSTGYNNLDILINEKYVSGYLFRTDAIIILIQAELEWPSLSDWNELNWIGP